MKKLFKLQMYKNSAYKDSSFKETVYDAFRKAGLK